MENKKEIIISEEFLNEAITQSSKRLVGVILRRFEVLEDKDAIKSAVKELIYEQYRQFREILNSYSFGVKFVTKKPEK